MASKTSIANKVGLGLLFGGIFLAGYHGCRSQSVVYERDMFGNVASVRLNQFGRHEELILDPKNPDRLIVKGTPALDYVCDSIGNGAKAVYDYCQSLKIESDSNNSQQKNDKDKKDF